MAKKESNEEVMIHIGYIRKDLEEIKKTIQESNDSYVTHDEFTPVKNIVYGFCALILVAVVGALLSLVMIK